MIRKYLADCWSTLIVYLFCVAVFALFCVLYDLKFSLIGDFVRFTWLVAVGAAFLKPCGRFEFSDALKVAILTNLLAGRSLKENSCAR